MGKAGIYCLIALLAPLTMLAGAINPEGSGHTNQTAIVQTGGQPVTGRWGNNRAQIATPSPQTIPPLVGLETYSLQPEHDFGFYGSGFGPGEQVEALLENPDVVPSPRSGLLLAKPYTNNGGNVAGRAYVPLLPAGNYSLLFLGLHSKRYTIVNLNIRGFNPWVTLSDYAPPPHTRIGFSGQDFAPGEPVLVYLNQKSGQPIAHLHADSTGQFDSEQAWVVPDVSGNNTLIFVGTYSGTVATVRFIPLETTTPVPAFSLLAESAGAQGNSAQSLPAGRGSTPPPVTSAAPAESDFSIGSFLQDPVTLALLFLGLWSVLCVLLILPLIVPRRHKQPSEKQPGDHHASLPESARNDHIETGHAVSSSPYPAPDPRSRSQDAEPEQPANFCPWCGLRNTTRSSRCSGCERELPQLPARIGSLWQQPTPPRPSGSGVFHTPSLSFSPLSQVARQALEPARAPAQASQGNERTLVYGHMPLALSMQAGAKSDRGYRRADRENEDDFLVVTGNRRARGEIQPFGLFVIADGMGGHNDGQKASRLIIETLFQDLIPLLLREDIPADNLLSLLQGAIQNANWRLYSQNEQEHSNLGATVTAALVAGREAAICNVGDSRVYLLSLQSPLHRVTVDHSIVESLVVAGIIQREDVYTHPKRNLIFRSVGQKQRVQIDTFRQPVIKGDQLLLCSDGLWEMVRDHEIERTLRQFQDRDQASGKLVELANEHGGLDNITAILVEMSEEIELTDQPVITHIDSNSVSVDQARRGLSLF